MTTTKTYAQVVGDRLRSHREVHRLRQDEVAQRARRWGLPLTRATVARIEAGKRELRVPELVLLTAALGISPTELIDGGDRITITITDNASAPSWAFAGQLGGTLSNDQRVQSFQFPEQRAIASAAVGERLFAVDEPGGTRTSSADEQEALISRTAQSEPARQAASSLSITPEEAARKAALLWEGGLTAERDRRVEARLNRTTSKRSAATLRGHVTRELIDELRAHDNEAGQ